MVNHMYWATVSTADGQDDLKAAKWESVVNHMMNIHQGHGAPFNECAHGPLVGREAKKRWIEPGIINFLFANSCFWVQTMYFASCASLLLQ